MQEAAASFLRLEDLETLVHPGDRITEHHEDGPTFVGIIEFIGRAGPGDVSIDWCIAGRGNRTTIFRHTSWRPARSSDGLMLASLRADEDHADIPPQKAYLYTIIAQPPRL